MKSLNCLFLAALLASLLIRPASAGNWPGWRGPNRDGSSTESGLLTRWPAGGPPLLWKATGCGIGFASVAVVGNRLFTMGEDREGSTVRALDVRTGQPVWTSAVVGKPGGGPPGPRSTPTVDGDRVYALGQHGDLVCLAAATGQELWRKSLTKDFGGHPPGWLYSESVLVEGDKVLATPGGPRGAVVALNKVTGAPCWQSAEFKDGAQYSSLIPADLCGVHQCIQLTEASVAGLAMSDGKMLWRVDRRGSTAVVPTPVCKGDRVYVSSGYGIGCNEFKVAKDGSELSAETVYANRNMINHHGGVILVGDYLYGFCDGKGWVCQNFATGELVWRHNGVGKGSLAYADGRLYLRSEGRKGTLALIEASPKGYAETGRFDQPDRSGVESWSHPVIANGRLYIRDQDVLLCYNVKEP